MTKLTIETLHEKLPHGSGIDANWVIDDMGKYFRATNSYHCMNDIGFYDGWAEFSVTIPKRSPKEFRLHFHGREAQYKARRYGLREYLEDTIYDAIEEMVSPN